MFLFCVLFVVVFVSVGVVFYVVVLVLLYFEVYNFGDKGVFLVLLEIIIGVYEVILIDV